MDTLKSLGHGGIMLSGWFGPQNPIIDITGNIVYRCGLGVLIIDYCNSLIDELMTLSIEVIFIYLFENPSIRPNKNIFC